MSAFAFLAEIAAAAAGAVKFLAFVASAVFFLALGAAWIWLMWDGLSKLFGG